MAGVSREQLRKGSLVALLLVGFGAFLTIVSKHQAPSTWLVFDYVRYWLVTLLFNAACLLGGAGLLYRLIPRGLPARERLVLSVALGVYVFFLGAFVAGLLQLYGPAFFFAWPLLLAAAGWWSAGPQLRALWARWRAHRRPPQGYTLTQVLLVAAGVVALLLLYAAVLVPENAAYDARWYHLPLAERYAALGGITRFDDGWYFAGYPQLASVLYAWVMQAPLGAAAHRMLACAHLEFSLFLWGVAAIPVVVRAILPRAKPALAWVAMFLFPGMFIYDSNLGVMADHINALFAAPIFLLLLRFLPRLAWRPGVVLGALMAAAMCTKYQGVLLVAMPILAVVVRCAWLTLRASSQPRWRPFLFASMAGLTMIGGFAPHWLKNLVWYGDPNYPFLCDWRKPTLWEHPEGNFECDRLDEQRWGPKGTTAENVVEAATTVFTFSFKPHNWWQMHRDVPVFGSLFTLLFFALPFVRAPRRLWLLYAHVNLGVFVWFLQTHQDRYLQALVPQMAAGVAAVLTLLWREGALVRAAAGLLVGLQVVWGGDVPFFNNHSMFRGSPLKVAIDRLSSGFHGNADKRLHTGSPVQAIGEALPADARPLLHDWRLGYALLRPFAHDCSEFSAGMVYGRLPSAAALHDKLTAQGLTHIVYDPDRAEPHEALATEIAFRDYVTHDARPWRTFGGTHVLTVAPQRPAENPYKPMLWLGCADVMDTGLYALPQLMLPLNAKGTRGAPSRAVPANDSAAVEAALRDAGSVAVNRKCVPHSPDLTRDFVRSFAHSGVEVWLRRR